MKSFKDMASMVREETDTSEKVEMAQSQLHFIHYACEEILEFIEDGGEVEEWYQVKIAKAFSEFESLHSYMEGEKRRTGMVDEEVGKTAPTTDAPKMVRDRKTGEMYDPKKKFKELMDKPETKATMNRLAKEEVEQIDELSKGTLASYAKKATHDSRIKMGIGKDFEKQALTSRKPGYKAASKELEDKYKTKARKREAGVGKAIDRLAQEEVEPIDELSKKTLGSYIKNATHDVAAKGAATRQFALDSAKKSSEQDYDGARKSMQKSDKTFSQSWKRRNNMAKAVDRLTKEEVEQIDEKNVPTSPEKWAQAKSQAKAKFDVYPCVPLDSLAISRSGPIAHYDLNIGDEILTYNMNKDVLEWKPVLHKHFYENAPLLEIGKPTGFSIRCTPNHKWVVSRTDKKELVETKDLNTHMKILMCSVLENDTTLMLENWSKKDNWVENVLSMNTKEREIFLASSIVYDGWDKGVSSKIKDRHTFGFVQKEYDHLWASLLAAYLNGYYVNTNERGDMTGATYIRNKEHHSTQNLYKKDSGVEDVWCPTTENQTWVMIQNGLITITGNSAYANGWAAKKYKEMGGGWKSVNEEKYDAPFEGGKPVSSNKSVVPGKYGVGPSTAKHLAKTAMKKQSDKMKKPVKEEETSSKLKIVKGIMKKKNQETSDSFQKDPTMSKTEVRM